MQHVFKKYFMLICLAVFACVVLTSCDLGLGGSNTPKVEVTQEMLNELKYESKTVKYDGEAHGIYVDNIYEKDGVIKMVLCTLVLAKSKISHSSGQYLTSSKSSCSTGAPVMIMPSKR